MEDEITLELTEHFPFREINKAIFDDEFSGRIVRRSSNFITISPRFDNPDYIKSFRIRLPLSIKKQTGAKLVSGVTLKTYEIGFKKKDIEKFKIEFRSKYFDCLNDNVRLAELLTILRETLELNLSVFSSSLKIRSCSGKGMKGVLAGYKLTDIAANSEKVMDLISKTAHKRKIIKQNHFDDFHKEMEKLGIRRD